MQLAKSPVVSSPLSHGVRQQRRRRSSRRVVGASKPSKGGTIPSKPTGTRPIKVGTIPSKPTGTRPMKLGTRPTNAGTRSIRKGTVVTGVPKKPSTGKSTANNAVKASFSDPATLDNIGLAALFAVTIAVSGVLIGSSVTTVKVQKPRPPPVTVADFVLKKKELFDTPKLTPPVAAFQQPEIPSAPSVSIVEAIAAVAGVGPEQSQPQAAVPEPDVVLTEEVQQPAAVPEPESVVAVTVTEPEPETVQIVTAAVMEPEALADVVPPPVEAIEVVTDSVDTAAQEASADSAGSTVVVEDVLVASSSDGNVVDIAAAPTLNPAVIAGGGAALLVLSAAVASRTDSADSVASEGTSPSVAVEKSISERKIEAQNWISTWRDGNGATPIDDIASRKQSAQGWIAAWRKRTSA